jgi:hypothetical protein
VLWLKQEGLTGSTSWEFETYTVVNPRPRAMILPAVLARFGSGTGEIGGTVIIEVAKRNNSVGFRKLSLTPPLLEVNQPERADCRIACGEPEPTTDTDIARDIFAPFSPDYSSGR